MDDPCAFIQTSRLHTRQKKNSPEPRLASVTKCLKASYSDSIRRLRCLRLLYLRFLFFRTKRSFTSLPDRKILQYKHSNNANNQELQQSSNYDTIEWERTQTYRSLKCGMSASPSRPTVGGSNSTNLGD